MGSFNMSCFASQQTIAPGDLCRVLPIVQKSSYEDILVSKGNQKHAVLGHTHSTCYYDSFWSPIGNFIAAKYDDYGCIELQLDEMARHYLVGLFNEIRQRGWSTEQGDNEHHDLGFDFATFLANEAPGMVPVLDGAESTNGWLHGTQDAEFALCWDYIWKVAQKHRLFMSDYKGRPRVFDFALIHEDAYAELVETESQGTDWDGMPLQPEAVLRAALGSARTLAGERVAKMDSGLPDMGGWFMGDRIREKLSRADGVGHSIGGPTSSLVSQLCEACWKKELSDVEFIDRCLPLLKDRYALAGLTRLNLRITPAVSAGQDYDNSEGRAYAKFVEKVSSAVTRGRLLEMYGEFKPYSMQVATPARVDAVVAFVPECDAAIENVSTLAADGTLTMNFDCTLELEDLQEILQEEFEDGELMSQSLTVRQQAA